MCLLSVIIPVFNDSKTIHKCILSIINQEISDTDVSMEILVIMDRCNIETERSVKKIEKQYANCICLKSDRLGVNAARNMGVFMAKGDILIFLDDDCIVADDLWLMRFWKKFNNYLQADAIGGGYHLKDTNNIFNICQNELTNFYVERGRLSNSKTEVLLGGNMAYRRNVFSNGNYFDEELIYGGAEAEFIVRLINSGKQIYYFDDIFVYHIQDRKNTILKFLIKNFKQGVGGAYSNIKNIKWSRRRSFQKGQQSWFFKIAKDINGNFVKKIVVGFIIFLYGLCYWCGYLWQLTICKIDSLIICRNRTLSNNPEP